VQLTHACAPLLDGRHVDIDAIYGSHERRPNELQIGIRLGSTSALPNGWKWKYFTHEAPVKSKIVAYSCFV